MSDEDEGRMPDEEKRRKEAYNQSEKTGQDDVKPGERPSGEGEPSEASAAGDNSGMRAYEPLNEVGEMLELSQNPEAPGTSLEGGMGAAYPILRDEELPPPPGLPTEDIIKPDESTSMRGAPLFSAAAFPLPGPTTGTAGAAAPTQIKSRIPKGEMTALLISDEQLKELWQRAKKAATGVEEGVLALQIGRSLLDEIQYFRNEILSGSGRFEEAERHLNEVEFRLAVNKRSQKWSYGIGIRLFLYELVWAILVLTVLIYWLGGPAFSGGSSDLIYLIGSMIWGGLGGVIGAWYALVKHIAIEQDFDKQHSIWYLNSPIMGIGVGAVVYAILRAGLLSIMGPTESIASPFVIYLLAWLAGYQQNVFTEIVKRILKVFKLEDGGQVEQGNVPAPPSSEKSTDQTRQTEEQEESVPGG